MNALTLKNGERVREGEIAIGGFLREISPEGYNSRFEGHIDELVELAYEHFESRVPGTGSVDGDVVLVPVPPERFRTNIVAITADNAFQVEEVYKARVEGEAAVPQLVLYSDEELPQARFANLVVYRADTLARDSGRTSDAEWEIIAVNAAPVEDLPMHPETMRRNAEHAKGGTYREYTDEEWRRSKAYWGQHAFLRSSTSL